MHVIGFCSTLPPDFHVEDLPALLHATEPGSFDAQILFHVAAGIAATARITSMQILREVLQDVKLMAANDTLQLAARYRGWCCEQLLRRN